MNCISENKTVWHGHLGRISTGWKPVPHHGFTLIEDMAAVALLVFIGASAWIVLERCMLIAADSMQQNRAFEVARENMEKLLGSASVTKKTEYGESEKFPDIHWQTTVEDFYPNPMAFSGRKWVRAICSAEYTDSAGKTKSVELVHWLTDLTEEQTQMLLEQEKLQEEQLAEHLIETEKLAAEYAGVNVETIREWVRNGMPTFEKMYLKPWLDLYYKTDGKPTEKQKQDLRKQYPELQEPAAPASPDELQEKPQQTEDNESPKPDDQVGEDSNEQQIGDEPFTNLPPMPSN
jgi:hypothetical protein